MQIKFKKLSSKAVIPQRAHQTDAGFDLVATSRIFDKDGNATYGTGIAVEIPEGYMGLVFPRSSIAKKDLALSNSVGIIDSGYRGEILAKFKPTLLYVDNPPLPSARIDAREPEGGSDQTDIRTQSVDFYGASSFNYDCYLEANKRFFDYGELHEDDNDYIIGRTPCTLNPRVYEVGDRIAQLVIVPTLDVIFEEADELTPTDRADGGYGSTGK